MYLAPSLDTSKAFDRIYHIKNFPGYIIKILIDW